MSLNTICFTGRAGNDPEIRYLDDGKSVASVPVAINQRKRKGEDQPPLWVEVSYWGATAQVLYDYVKKGSLIGVSGRLEPADAWVDKQGNARARLKVAGNTLELISSPQDQQAPAAARPSAQELPF